MPATPTRRRRSSEMARATILAAAEQLLVEGGVNAVQVRAVARKANMTDAGVTHHFGDLQGLLTALIEAAGQRARAMIDRVVEEWLAGEVDVEPLLRALATPYRKGYAELAVALHAAGWRDRGEPVFGKVVQAIHDVRVARSRGAAPDLLDTRLAVAAFHQAIATDPLFGEEFRRSAGLKSSAGKGAEQQLDWWIRAVRRTLDL
ncbi:helix-turn-helix domain-containing protein [Phreatobacter stygius]|uniref:TetR/AcrR family transcriptional regulator n=1 Tax=Phreatobacter stygius TaxID=1940610 RepID=A0A4D7AWQ0_9HYPH|nr:helix-turn-helix domain-containing protein [Phreatobacter stygius]QCI63383.1 TetR/AcrR family transcriptional regulator [Phreatobacter stygius]